jgi:hypothetical protein
MRTAAGLVTVLFAGVMTQAWAADPPSPPQSPAPTATAPAEQQSAAPAAAPQTAPAASESGAIKPPVTVTSSKPEDLTLADKELLSRGYKLEMRHGEKYFCRREQQIGSRFEVKNCDTAESIESHRASGQEALRTIQNDRPQINK